MRMLLSILSTPVSLPIVAILMGVEFWRRRLERIGRWSSHKVKRLRS